MMPHEPTKQDAVELARRGLTQLRDELLARRERMTDGDGKIEFGHWTGRLSASALGTATAVSALCTLWKVADQRDDRWLHAIKRGCAYLDTQQNSDGGYGDTDRSHSNIATAYLVLAARTLAASIIADDAGTTRPAMTQLQTYIKNAGELEGLRRRYGKDKTFVVPILTNLAIAGLVPWSLIPRLPFEAAVFPGAMYRFLKMPVVSYAIPALVAMGQAHHFLGPPPLKPLHWIRRAAVSRSTDVLQRMQPESGGYLEATPLTAFVLMSLAASQNARRSQSQDTPAHQSVMKQAVSFLINSMRDDGSWPIDTNLATWVTSLSIHALSRWRGDNQDWATLRLVQWHLNCQHQQQHPFTGAAPGGWGWTDLTGAVPDADDTPAAILAANQYRRSMPDQSVRDSIDVATQNGLHWLADLQNRDGGLPTFCRGWGQLPFDRSSTDLTAHFVRAVDATPRSPYHSPRLWKDLDRSRNKAIRFLQRTQRADGSWLPLWFGNQDQPHEENPIYGTSRVLLALVGFRSPTEAKMADKAVDYLLQCQNEDGGWGGGPSVSLSLTGAGLNSFAVAIPEGHRSSIEETSLALEGLATYLQKRTAGCLKANAGRDARVEQSIIDASVFLVGEVESNHHRAAWPIGFYFAKLWYYEDLYPIVFATAALGAVVDTLSSHLPHPIAAASTASNEHLTH